MQSTRVHKTERELSNIRSVISAVPDRPLSGVTGLWAE